MSEMAWHVSENPSPLNELIGYVELMVFLVKLARTFTDR